MASTVPDKTYKAIEPSHYVQRHFENVGLAVPSNVSTSRNVNGDAQEVPEVAYAPSTGLVLNAKPKAKKKAR